VDIAVSAAKETVAKVAAALHDSAHSPIVSSESVQQQFQPPLNAQFLLDLFLPDAMCEAFLGDLQERYNKKLPRLGKTRADWWYRKQVAASLWPFFREFVGRSSKGMFARLLCIVLRTAGLSTW